MDDYVRILNKYDPRKRFWHGGTAFEYKPPFIIPLGPATDGTGARASRPHGKQVIALGQLGWTLRRIEQATGVRLVFELATGRFVAQHQDGLFLGRPGTGKSHLAQAIGFAVIQPGHRVLYREAHVLLEELAEAQLAGTRKQLTWFQVAGNMSLNLYEGFLICGGSPQLGASSGSWPMRIGSNS